MVSQSIGILATGSYVPETEITNADLAPGLDVTTEWIERKTAIRTRRYAAPSEATSDLAIRAATNALDQIGLPADRIDYLIVPTSTGDAPLPPTSCLVQAALGARRAACFDLNIACSGFVYGLAVAQGLVANRPGSHALVVAADIWSRFIDPNDRGTTVLLADAAGAAVVGPVPDGYGILETDLLGYGDQADLLTVEAGGSRRPASHETVDEIGHVLRMRGREVTEFVLGNVPQAVKELLARAGVAREEVEHFVPHQANGVLLRTLAEQIGLENARTHLTVEEYGNSGVASMPVTLDQAHRSGALRDGELVLLSGFGGGMALGHCLLRWKAGVAR
ncbi:3-oxoacyl-ACP synthase III family protein [Amycolatopsis anabasis]|uniref:3-oxoacyl-ACP synthase III family protein n=1 Tax=Amycolatopsis anabasis TaxID=1840409 RepID=UPI00131B7BB5|nr:ketoacyl-ACP synthase III [Amycolatopsis anabasis]